jgi:hypothetical protein
MSTHQERYLREGANYAPAPQKFFENHLTVPTTEICVERFGIVSNCTDYRNFTFHINDRLNLNRTIFSNYSRLHIRK